MQGFKTALQHKKISKGSQSEPFEIFLVLRSSFATYIRANQNPKEGGGEPPPSFGFYVITRLATAILSACSQLLPVGSQ